ncbi:MAG: methyltransferase domain-containing protein [Candidatus Woesearchaeota archaeon]|nr:MAG: methyltransferase domain-containing protein [Candidatus Woesearchaeota archaeon]
MEVDFKELVVNEFSGKNAQLLYIKKAKEGLWDSESYFFKQYFTKKKASILDIGCGTGRTTIPLVKKGFTVVGIDITPAMISNAKNIAKKNKLRIDYRVGDATRLAFENESFDYALFSNQGWTQIPGKKNRLSALTEVCRILKPQGMYIFTAHIRKWTSKYFFFYLKQWMRFYLLKPLGFPIEEIEFGDRLFERPAADPKEAAASKQYIHIPAKKEVMRSIQKSGFEILEVNGSMQRSYSRPSKDLPTFFICRKK